MNLKKSRILNFASSLVLGSVLTVSNCDLLSQFQSNLNNLTLNIPAIPATCETGLHFTYTDVACWAVQDASYATCGTGTQQSPIDLPSSTRDLINGISGFSELIPTSDWEVLNNGHTVEVRVNIGAITPSPYYIILNGINYELEQFHFHTTSEHTINGQGYAMEMHLVHTDPATGQHAVVGVLMDDTIGTQDWFFTSLTSALATLFPASTTGGWPTAAEATTPVSGAASNQYLAIGSWISGLNAGYYNYNGSLTTPPCTENVAQWIVLDTPVGVNSTTVSNFLTAIGGHTNNRPVQPLNGRTVAHH